MKKIWQKKIIAPITAELKKGVDPRRLARAAALGAVTALFPMLGVTAVLGFLLGYVMKLNQVALIAVNYLLYPLQLLLLPFFIRAGEKLLSLEPVTFSPVEWTTEFRNSPGLFISHYGQSIGSGVLVWLILAIPLCLALEKWIFYPIFKRLPKDQSELARRESVPVTPRKQKL